MTSQAGMMQLAPRNSSFRQAIVTKSRVKRDIVRVCLSPPMRLTSDPRWLGDNQPQIEASVNRLIPSRGLTSWTIKSLLPAPLGIGGVCRRHRSRDKELGETTTMHQEGHEIQEVPLAVLKEKSFNSIHKSYIDLNAREEAAFVEGFNNFNSPQQILKILETIPTQEVTPFVSLGILTKLFELESNFVFRNDGMPWTISSENSAIDTFARTAIVTQLIDTIVTSDDNAIVLGALNALKCERPLGNANEYREKLFQEILLRVTKGQFTVHQVCEAIISLGKIERDTKISIPNSLIDKLWIGIFEKSEEINVDNIAMLFQVLPHFQKSRRLVLNLAEKKLLAMWWKMDSKLVAKICEILMAESTMFVKNRVRVDELNPPSEAVGVSNRVLSALSRCTNLNIHHITETELFTIVRAFKTQNFCDTSFEKALNKYMKAKCLKISDPNVVAAIMDYVKKFHIRSTSLLEAVAEFTIVQKCDKMSAPNITSVITAFGHLDFQPPNGVRFWQIIEGFLNDKFIQFTPNDIISVLLSCVFLTKFPINFVDRLFSPYFLDRVHNVEQDFTYLQNMRSKMKLLDTALTIECPNKYGGPMLPKDFSSKSVFIDGRVLRMGNWLEVIVKEVLGVKCSVEKFVVLPCLPLNPLYIADLVLSKTKGFDSDRYSYLKSRISSRLNTGVQPMDDDKNLTIILIHVQEHYTRDGENLIGSEVMRIRHLKAVGFNVVTVDHTKVSELKVHPSALREYLKERLVDAGYTCS